MSHFLEGSSLDVSSTDASLPGSSVPSLPLSSILSNNPIQPPSAPSLLQCNLFSPASVLSVSPVTSFPFISFFSLSQLDSFFCCFLFFYRILICSCMSSQKKNAYEHYTMGWIAFVCYISCVIFHILFSFTYKWCASSLSLIEYLKFPDELHFYDHTS